MSTWRLLKKLAELHTIISKFPVLIYAPHTIIPIAADLVVTPYFAEESVVFCWAQIKGTCLVGAKILAAYDILSICFVAKILVAYEACALSSQFLANKGSSNL